MNLQGAQKLRISYYSKLQTNAKSVVATENRRRTSVIEEEDGENTPLLGSRGSHSISNAADGFLVSVLL